jgi:hypothetical protein
VTSRTREPRPDDQDGADVCYEFILSAILSHGEKDTALWMAALWSLLVERYIDSGVSYEQFCSELEGVKGNYVSWWEGSDDFS